MFKLRTIMVNVPAKSFGSPPEKAEQLQVMYEYTVVPKPFIAKAATSMSVFKLRKIEKPVWEDVPKVDDNIDFKVGTL